MSVNYATASGTAAADTDYSSINGTLTFADGEVTKTIIVPIINDNLVELSETFQVVLSNPLKGSTPDNTLLSTNGAATNGLSSTSAATLTIRDDEIAAPGKFQFRQSTASVREDAGFIDVTVDRVLGQKGTVKVQYLVSGITATSGVDFTSALGTLTFAENETSKTFRVIILNDSRIDPNERISLRLLNATNGSSLGTITTAVLTIIDDEINAPGTIQFSQATSDVREDAGFVDLTVTRTNGSKSGISVKYAVTGGTAISGQDFAPVSGTLTFAEGETTKKIRVAVINNQIADGTRTLQLMLSQPTAGATLGLSQLLLSILDDETSPVT